LSQPQTGMKRSNPRRTLRSISASVGRPWRQWFCQRCRAGCALHRLVMPKRVPYMCTCGFTSYPSVIRDELWCARPALRILKMAMHRP
jgi:hypothetical protein